MKTLKNSDGKIVRKQSRFLKIAAVIAVLVSTLFITKCNKDVVVVQTYSVLGNCTYPDFSNNAQLAKGTVINIYQGMDTTGNLIATTFADSSGNYRINGLYPGPYYIVGKYNTINKNYAGARLLQGVNFVTSGGYAINVGTSNVTQNVYLSTVPPTGNVKIAIDTITANQTFRKGTVNTHSKVNWSTDYSSNNASLTGAFNKFVFTKFAFDEANPGNSKLVAYVLLSTINTYETARDTPGACVSKTICVDTAKSATGAISVLAQTDTCWFNADYGTIVKYGKGYLAHGTLTGFYKHQGGEIVAPRITPVLPDTAGGYAGPWDVPISKPCDMYFEYQGKNKVYSGANFSWYFNFEGTFKFVPTDYYIISSSIGPVFTVTPHVMIQGSNNIEY